MTKRNSQNFSKNEKCQKTRLLKCFATGRFSEAEIILTNNPNLRSVLLHLPGLRHTAFFQNMLKRRIRFYRDYARKNNMVGGLNANNKQELRDQFAASNCKTRAIRDAAKRLMHDLQATARRKKIMRKRRRRVFGLF